jgi:hypothetical protein
MNMPAGQDGSPYSLPFDLKFSSEGFLKGYWSQIQPI